MAYGRQGDIEFAASRLAIAAAKAERLLKSGDRTKIRAAVAQFGARSTVTQKAAVMRRVEVALVRQEEGDRAALAAILGAGRR